MATNVDYLSQKIVKSQLKRRPSKAAFELGLHYFLWRINATSAVKRVNVNQYKKLCTCISHGDTVQLTYAGSTVSVHRLSARTLAAVTSLGVHAHILTAAVVYLTLVNVCEHNKKHAHKYY